MVLRRARTLAAAFKSDRRGNISIVAALSMPVLLGFVGLGAEAASWYSGKRSLQNAADSAAIAAATNASASYADEAKAVAARYGFQDGVNGVTIAVANNVTCPDGSAKCYSVTISRLQPMILAQVTGYQGDATFSGSPAKRIAAKAVAIQGTAPRKYCVLALAGSGDPEALRTNGAPKADLTGCNVMSNSNANCNGHDLKADFGDAAGTNDGCGKKRNSNVDELADPYAGLESNIPAQSCPNGFPIAPKKKKDPALPPENVLSGTETRSLIQMCGDVELSSDVTIASGSSGSVLVIKDGSLNLNGHTLRTANGSALTVIFTGDNNSRTHAPIGSGTFDFQAPTSGTWKGVAMYQDPSVTGGVDISEAGNTPTWTITGLVYLPHASVTFSGAVNKSSYGKSCFGLVVDNLLINGTGSILAHGECDEAGLDLPFAEVPTRGELVS